MRRMHVIGLALCAVFVAGLPARAVTLRYAPKVGDTVKHKVSLAGRTSSGAEDTGDNPLAEAMRMEVSGTIQYAEKALSETTDTVRIETQVTGGKFTWGIGGQSQNQQMPKGKVVADMDRRGRLVKTIETTFSGKSGAQDFMTGGAGGWSNFSSFAVFPEGDVKAGDTWSDEIKIPAAQGVPEVNLTLSSRLLDLTTVDNRKCAKIRTTFKGPFNLDTIPGAGDSSSMEATLQGDLVWYYDYENSVYVSGEGQVGMNMNINVSGPEIAGMPVSIKMLMNIKLSLIK
ncbi:MAG: hypothetical protein ABSD48_05585 [Armatimonadota bacterium]